MICASCGEPTSGNPCETCGFDPLLQGRYRLIDVAGHGGLGTTYRAHDTRHDRTVAIKELPLKRASSPKHSQLFEREAQVLQQLDHPTIPAYVDHFSAGRGKHRALYLVQEFIEGTDLQASLDHTRYSVRHVLEILVEVLPALIYLHELSPPVVHRDIKPHNLMRSESGRLYLVDFGSVRDALQDDDLGGSTVAGTFGFMAPEQFMGAASPAYSTPTDASIGLDTSSSQPPSPPSSTVCSTPTPPSASHRPERSWTASPSCWTATPPRHAQPCLPRPPRLQPLSPPRPIP